MCALKVIVAGSRSITDAVVIKTAIEHARKTYGLIIAEVVEGEAVGVDKLAKEWAIENGVPFKPFKPRWDYLEAPGAVIRVNKFGNRYNTRAGYERNQLMADYGEAWIAIWDGKSTGTLDMMKKAVKKGMPGVAYLVDDNKRLVLKADGEPLCVTYNVEE